MYFRPYLQRQFEKESMLQNYHFVKMALVATGKGNSLKAGRPIRGQNYNSLQIINAKPHVSSRNNEGIDAGDVTKAASKELQTVQIQGIRERVIKCNPTVLSLVDWPNKYHTDQIGKSEA